jgi:hypothetical protein
MNLQAGILSGTPPARALPPCLESTTAPVRHFFQDVNYGSTDMDHMMPASINVESLWNVKVQTSGERMQRRRFRTHSLQRTQR